jgi:hypothetical protein
VQRRVQEEKRMRGGAKKDPRLKRGEVTDFRKNQSVGEYHQSKVAI